MEKALTIIYSFNKRGYESVFWHREIAAASSELVQFVPFNHDPYVDVSKYVRAQLLDNLYFNRSAGLLKMYSDLERLIVDRGASALIVDNCFPYHPEFLRRLRVFKVLRTTDGPLGAYDRDFAYLHAYDYVLHHTNAYSPDITMPEKLRYCGAKAADFWPLGLFDACWDSKKTESELMAQDRDVDVIFIGRISRDKMAILAKIRKALGNRLRMYGMTSPARNVYWNLKYGFPGWVRPARFEEYVPLYQRSKIGFNVHNRGDYTVGGYRLFELPANGVMQISDGGEFLKDFYEVGTEVESYSNVGELVEKIFFYLDHDAERKRVALAGYRRACRDYRHKQLMIQAAEMIGRRMDRDARC